MTAPYESNRCTCKHYPTGIIFEVNSTCPHHGEKIDLTPTSEEKLVDIRDIIEAYLATRSAQLWPPDTWYLTSEDRRWKAGNWLHDVWMDLVAIRNMALGSSGKDLLTIAKQYRDLKEGYGGK